MNRIKLYSLILVLYPCVLLNAQHNDKELERLSQLSGQGQFRELIDTAKPLLNSPNSNTALNPLEQGKAWTYVGYAYEEEGDFTNAVPSYEKALEIMGRNGEDTKNYATTLSTFSSLYLQMGQPETAKRMLLRSLRIYEGNHDHAGMAMTWSNLGMIAVSRNLKHEAHKCVERAIHESELTHDLEDDYFSSLSSTQARLFELDGNPAAAVSAYEHSLALWEHAHGEQHPEVGWLNILLGKACLEAGNISKANEKT